MLGIVDPINTNDEEESNGIARRSTLTGYVTEDHASEMLSEIQKIRNPKEENPKSRMFEMIYYMVRNSRCRLQYRT